MSKTIESGFIFVFDGEKEEDVLNDHYLDGIIRTKEEALKTANRIDFETSKKVYKIVITLEEV